MKSIWNEILIYETRDLVEKHQIKMFGRKPSAKKLDQITSNFVQAREYFQSAELSNITVKPLLLYYGVMAMSKGLILSLDKNITEEQFKSSHGLDVKNWKEVQKSMEFENIEITIGEGTFTELLKNTKNTNLLRSNSTNVNYFAQLKAPTKGTSISLKKVVQYFPDLNNEFFHWTGEKLIFLTVKSLKSNPTTKKVEVKIVSEPKDGSIDLCFPLEFCENRISKKIIDGNILVEYDDNGWYPNLTQKWTGPFDIGDVCAIPPIQNDIGLNLLGGMYIMSYVFGMMARYFPTTWIRLRRAEKGDRIYPFAQNIIDFVYEYFPRQVLDFLQSEQPL